MAELPRSRRDLVGLTVLALLVEEPRHPYEMQRLIRDRHKDFVTGLPRSLYHAVDRLVKADLIEPAATSREGSRPERTVYRITAEGREEFESWLSELIAFPVTEHPLFTAAVSLMAALPRETALRNLQIRAAALEGEIANLQAQLRGVTPLLPRLLLLEVEYSVMLRQAELSWVSVLVDDIQSGRLSWYPWPESPDDVPGNDGLTAEPVDRIVREGGKGAI